MACGSEATLKQLKPKKDEFYDWFQESHDFKILTKEQQERVHKLKTVRLQPKLNTTAPLKPTEKLTGNQQSQQSTFNVRGKKRTA